ncbi:unnamed protein product, partial [Musa hybrid cultivar]
RRSKAGEREVRWLGLGAFTCSESVVGINFRVPGGHGDYRLQIADCRGRKWWRKGYSPI